jgi:hypothetical protein
MRRFVGLALLVGALGGATATEVPTAAAATPSFGSARLQGEFLMNGHVTKSVNIRGEHVGETVKRKWFFTPRCASGACSSIGLVRKRPHGTDTLTLTRQRPGFYAGSGKFYAPLRCGGRVYRKGESVPYTIQVRITAASTINGVDRATTVRAWYKNRRRHNLTRCVAIPGHDAAGYSGSLATGGVA